MFKKHSLQPTALAKATTVGDNSLIGCHQHVQMMTCGSKKIRMITIVIIFILFAKNSNTGTTRFFICYSIRVGPLSGYRFWYFGYPLTALSLVVKAKHAQNKITLNNGQINHFLLGLLGKGQADSPKIHHKRGSRNTTRSRQGIQQNV